MVNFLTKQCRKSAMMTKQKQIPNKADSSVHGKVNPVATLHADLLERLLDALT